MKGKVRAVKLLINPKYARMAFKYQQAKGLTTETRRIGFTQRRVHAKAQRRSAKTAKK
jgi:hypothetical protein